MISVLLGFCLNLLPAQEVDQILADHFDAIGQNSLSSFRTCIIEGKIIQNGRLEYDFTTHVKRKHKVRTELRIGKEVIIDVLNGGEGWHKDFNNQYDLSESEKRKLLFEGLIDSRLYFLQEQGIRLKSLGKKTIVDDRYFHLQADFDGTRYSFFIHEESKLLYRIIEEEMGAEKSITEITYYDYRDFGGIKIPLITRKIGPQGRVQTRIKEVAFDVAVSESLFTKP